MKILRTASGLPILDFENEPPPAHYSLYQAAGDYLREHYATECAGQDAKRPQQTFWKAFEILGYFAEIEKWGRAESREYTRARVAEGVTPATVRRELTFVQAACNHARREERIRAEIKFQMPAASPPRLRFLTREEYRRLMAAPKHPRLHRFFVLAFATGARSRAIEELTWDRVDFKARTIDYRCPGVRYKNKRRAVVPISDALLVRLQNFPRDDEYVIGRGDSGRVTSCYHQARRCLASIGINERGVARHVARHTVASWLLQGDKDREIPPQPIHIVAQMLGDTVGMVEKTYAHVLPSHLMAAANAL